MKTTHEASGRRPAGTLRSSLSTLALVTIGLTLAFSVSTASASKQVVDFFGAASGFGALGGEFRVPQGTAVNQSGAGPANQGDVYVADTENNRVQRLGRNDNGTPADSTDDTYFFISAWGADVDSTPSGGSDYEICTVAANCKAGAISAASGALSGPSGIAVDQDSGDVYVSDTENNRINVYGGDGAFLRSFGAGQIGSGQGIAVSQPDGNPASGTVFLADTGNHRVDTFNLDGSSPSSFGAATFSSIGSGYNQPTQVAVDSRGIVYADNLIADFANGTTMHSSHIERYDSENANGGGVGFLTPIFSPFNERQQVTFNATSGQFRLSFGADTTPDLPFDADGAQIKAALEALPSIGAGNVSVSASVFASNAVTITVTFIGALAATDVSQLVAANGTIPLSGGPPAVSTEVEGLSGPLLSSPGGPQTPGLAVDPDSDGAGPDSDVLYVLRNALIGGFTTPVVQQFGPANPPGLTAPPTAADDTHGTDLALESAAGLAVDQPTARLYVTSSGIFGFGHGLYVLDDVGPTPTASLDSISDVTATAATIHATINPNGPPNLSYHLEYSLDGSNWKSMPSVLLGHQASPQAIDTVLSPPGPGLEPSTFYHVRLVAQRPFFAAVISAEKTFTTLAEKPSVETVGTPLRTTTTAQLAGRVNPRNSATTYFFEYGDQGPCDANPCTATETHSAGSADLIELVAQDLEGLQPGTTYHYRVVADNGNLGSPSVGEDMTVATRAAEAPLSHGHLAGPPGSDRAYEQVSVADSGGNPVNFGAGFSADGNRALYSIAGGTPLSNTGSLASLYFAQRTEQGPHAGSWQTKQITPPRSEIAGPTWLALDGGSDLSSVLAVNFDLPSGTSSLWRLAPTGQPAKLSQVSPPQKLDLESSGFSADGTRVVALMSGGTLDPAYPAAAATSNLYDLSSGAPQLVSLLPGDVVSSCGVNSAGMPPERSHWISADGSLVFFLSQQGVSCGGLELFMRDLLAGTTKPISGPGTAFIRTIPGAAFYWREGDVYRYDFGEENSRCITCVTPGLSGNAAGATAGTGLYSIAVAQDGSRAYFKTKTRLLPDAQKEGEWGVYRVDVASGDLAYVAPIEGNDVSGEYPSGGSTITPDGSVFVLRSSAPELNALGGSDNGGVAQYYRYDDNDRSLVCISCPTGNTAPADVPLSMVQTIAPSVSPLSTDGETLAFATPTALLGADQNTPGAGQDPNTGTDVYEWRDGRLLLVTDGLTNWPFQGSPKVHGVSPSGHDIFFTAPIQYTQDALDGYNRLYDARIGGGFEFPKPPPPCPLEVCQGTPKGAPEEQAPGTGNFVGPGNSKPAARKHKKAQHKKRHHKRKARHQRRANHDRRAAR